MLTRAVLLVWRGDGACAVLSHVFLPLRRWWARRGRRWRRRHSRWRWRKEKLGETPTAGPGAPRTPPWSLSASDSSAPLRARGGKSGWVSQALVRAAAAAGTSWPKPFPPGATRGTRVPGCAGGAEQVGRRAPAAKNAATEKRDYWGGGVGGSVQSAEADAVQGHDKGD